MSHHEPTAEQVAMLDQWMRPEAARELLRKVLASPAAAAPEPVAQPLELAKHGWVRPRADGAKARCGGPGVCKHCQGEQLLIAAHPAPAVAATVRGLTDAQVNALFSTSEVYQYHPGAAMEFAREVERACAEAWGVTLPAEGASP